MGDIPSAAFENSSQNLETDSVSLAKEIVSTRVVWNFEGVCANGTQYPNGEFSKDDGAVITGTGSILSESSFYHNSTTKFNPNSPFLVYPSALFDAAYSSRDVDPKSLLISFVPSMHEGYVEVLLIGKSATMDDRPDCDTTKYILS